MSLTFWVISSIDPPSDRHGGGVGVAVFSGVGVIVGEGVSVGVTVGNGVLLGIAVTTITCGVALWTATGSQAANSRAAIIASSGVVRVKVRIGRKYSNPGAKTTGAPHPNETGLFEF